MSKTRLNSNMSDELYNMKKFATTVIATDVKENKEKVFITITNTPNEYHNYYSDDWITSPLYEAYNVEEKLFTLFDVYSADECFLTGTAAEVIPVAKVDGRVIGRGKAGEITAKLIAAFHEFTKVSGVTY